MATYVLVHGAWHGGWCWRDTAAALRAAGHTVFTPTHTGLGERFHRSDEAVTLETHVRDVCGVLEWEELSDVVLVGHSYGGMVITGVADRLPERVRALVYLDAFVPENGDTVIGLIERALPPEAAAQLVGAFRGSALQGHSGLMQPIPAAVFNVAEANRERVDRLCRPQALATFEMPLQLTGAVDRIGRRLYILADDWEPSPFRYFARRCAQAPGWQVVTMAVGHDVMVDRADGLAALLSEVA